MLKLKQYGVVVISTVLLMGNTAVFAAQPDSGGAKATQTALAAETANRITGDQADQAAINAESVSRVAGDQANQAALATETTSRVAGDQASQAAVSLETADRNIQAKGIYSTITAAGARSAEGDKANQDAITAEIISRKAAMKFSINKVLTETKKRVEGDKVNQDALTAESAIRIEGDSANANAVTKEAAIRASMGKSLHSRLVNEITDRTDGDGANKRALGYEIKARTVADQALQKNIDTISLTPGAKGDTGAQGPQGAKGDTGATGLQGPKGNTGAPGIAGLKGDTGAPGIAGLKGDTGAQGSQGAKGDAGTNGIDGINGADGLTGPVGSEGSAGPAGVNAADNSADLCALYNHLSDMSMLGSLPVPSYCKKKIIFASSTKYEGGLGGLAGADVKCQTAATAAGLQGTYKAWLSTATVSAASRLTHSDDKYVRTDGEVIADSWLDLTDGSLNVPINLDENGAMLEAAKVWSNTTLSGEISATATNGTCANWTASRHANGWNIWGRSGSNDAVDQTWTEGGGNCVIKQSLYCVAQ